MRLSLGSPTLMRRLGGNVNKWYAIFMIFAVGFLCILGCFERWVELEKVKLNSVAPVSTR